MFLHTPGTAATLTQGWAELHADAGIVAYTIFTNRVPGHQDQDSTAPAVNATNRVPVPYDDANGFVSAIAIVNPTATPQSVSVGFQTTDGLIAIDALPIVPAMGHMTFVLSQQFPHILGHLGLAEFYSATGNLSMIALRFNPTQSSASMPCFSNRSSAYPSASGDRSLYARHLPCGSPGQQREVGSRSAVEE